MDNNDPQQENEASPIEQQIRAMEASISAFESLFNGFTIVGGDGVEVSGNLKTGFVINKR